MMQFVDWLSPVTLRFLALALLHFLWQGAALAAVAYVLMALCRSASARYVVGVGTLALMLAAPIGSFLYLRGRDQSTAALISSNDEAPASRVAIGAPLVGPARSASPDGDGNPYLLWMVEAWFAGVLLLSLRSAGGFLVVERLRRKESAPVAQELVDLCLSLQQRMGLDRAIRYCQSVRLEAPVVVGWIRPIVLLPMSAISGLSEEQLEAVIAHELAHIQRHDAFVHLFQVAVETLLFYHPAVWWLGKRIRAEREHCCDDTAVRVCGSPVIYAHALTRLAESKSAPQLVMAANRSPLVERIARLLGAGSERETFRSANITAGVLCLAAALLAGSAVIGNAKNAQAQTPAAAEPASTSPASAGPAAHVPAVPGAATVARQSSEGTAPAVASHAEPTANAAAPAIAVALSIASPMPAPQAPSSTPKQSYIESLKDAGLSNLSVDELIGLKVQGVTADYVKSMKDLGMKIDVNDLIGMKVQGITPEYVKEMRATIGESLGTDALIGLKVQGVTPEYVRQIHDLQIKIDADEIIGMKVQGITPEYVREMRGLGLKIDSGELIGMKVQGITSEYLKSFQDLGFHPSTNELIGMKVQGVSAAYIKSLQDAGLKVDINQAIGAKVQGITPEWIAKARSHGFNNVTLDKLIQLKVLGILDNEK